MSTQLKRVSLAISHGAQEQILQKNPPCRVSSDSIITVTYGSSTTLRQLVPVFLSGELREKSSNCARMISRALELELENGTFFIENVTNNGN